MRLIIFILSLSVLSSCTNVSRQDTQFISNASGDIVLAQKPYGTAFLIDSTLSDLRIVTYAKGRFGHAHVIGGEALTGEIILPVNHHDVWFDMSIQVTDLQVDKPRWREDEDLDPEMTKAAVVGTRENMLSDKLLNANRYPTIRIQAVKALGPVWQPDIDAKITLVGVSRDVNVPVAVHRVKNTIEVTGQIQLLQSDFGIKPFTALGGILGVADKLLIRFRIHATAK